MQKLECRHLQSGIKQTQVNSMVHACGPHHKYNAPCSSARQRMGSNLAGVGRIPQKRHLAVPRSAPIVGDHSSPPEEMVQRIDLGQLREKALHSSAEARAHAGLNVKPRPPEEACGFVCRINKGKRRDQTLLSRKLEEDEQRLLLAFQVSGAAGKPLLLEVRVDSLRACELVPAWRR